MIHAFCKKCVCYEIISDVKSNLINLEVRARWNEIVKLSDYITSGDSVSLTRIDDKPFTITSIEDSDYTQGDETTKGVKFTTKEYFEIEGNKVNRFHTTRIAIVNALSNEKIREDVNGKNIPLGPLKCVSDKTKTGKTFVNLVDAQWVYFQFFYFLKNWINPYWNHCTYTKCRGNDQR